jgi:hypothetical protein
MEKLAPDWSSSMNEAELYSIRIPLAGGRLNDRPALQQFLDAFDWMLGEVMEDKSD